MQTTTTVNGVDTMNTDSMAEALDALRSDSTAMDTGNIAANVAFLPRRISQLRGEGNVVGIGNGPLVQKKARLPSSLHKRRRTDVQATEMSEASTVETSQMFSFR